MQYIQCDLCQADNSKVLFYDNNFRLVKCLNCGLVYINPRPEGSELKKIYQAPLEQMPADSAYYVNYIQNEGGFRREAESFLREIKKINNNGNLLDIGCGPGFLLDEARAMGYLTYGCEIKNDFYLYAKNTLGLQVLEGSLEELRLDSDFFDVVCMLDILSHLESPSRTIAEICRVIKKGGLLLIKTGNKGGFETRGAGELLGDRWGSPQHLYHFSKITLKRLLEQNNFTVIKITSIVKIYGFLKSLLPPQKLSSATPGQKRAVVKDMSRSLLGFLEQTLGRLLGGFNLNSTLIIYAIKNG